MEQMSISKAKALKKISRENLFFENAPHAPNKNESECLRRIMSKTGLSDEEVRSHKIYRKQLADASKEHGNKSKEARYIIRFLKRITKKTKLPIDHPLTKELFISEWNEMRENCFWSRYSLSRVNGEAAYSTARYLKSARIKKD